MARKSTHHCTEAHMARVKAKDKQTQRSERCRVLVHDWFQRLSEAQKQEIAELYCKFGSEASWVLCESVFKWSERRR